MADSGELDLMTDFLTHSQGRGTVKQWKKDGSIVVWPHGGKVRWRACIRIPFLDKDEESFDMVTTLRYICCEPWNSLKYRRREGWEAERDPVLKWLQAIKENSRIPDDREVLMVGSGRDAVVVYAGDLRKVRGHNWKSTLEPKVEYVIPAVPHENPEPVVFIETQSLGERYRDTLKERIEELGNEDGDIVRNPAPVKFRYKAENPPPTKYSAQMATSERYMMTDAVRQQLDRTPADLSRYTQPGDVQKARRAIIAGMKAASMDDVVGNVDDFVNQFFPASNHVDADVELPRRDNGERQREERPVAEGVRRAQRQREQSDEPGVGSDERTRSHLPSDVRGAVEDRVAEGAAASPARGESSRIRVECPHCLKIVRVHKANPVCPECDAPFDEDQIPF